MISILEQSKNPWKTNIIIQNLRRDKINQLKKQLNINFDLENNDPVGNKRDIRIQTGVDSNNTPEINLFRCQMMEAGGDWEY